MVRLPESPVPWIKNEKKVYYMILLYWFVMDVSCSELHKSKASVESQ